VANESRLAQGHESDSEHGVKRRRRSKPVKFDFDLLKEESSTKGPSHRRRKRCGKCKACLTPECGKCENCRSVILAVVVLYRATAYVL